MIKVGETRWGESVFGEDAFGQSVVVQRKFFFLWIIWLPATTSLESYKFNISNYNLQKMSTMLYSVSFISWVTL